MQLGMAISAARQLGLDKPSDEVFFGTRRAKHQLNGHQPLMLKKTWLKCFELDVQMSLWHGNLPTLGLPQHLQPAAAFCRDPQMPPEFTNTIEIYIRTAQYLITLQDDSSQWLSTSTIRLHIHALEAVKTDHALTWTAQNEIVLWTAKMYLFATCFVKLTQVRYDSVARLATSPTLVNEVLERAQLCAIQVVHSFVEVASEPRASDSSHISGACPLPGSPKHQSRILFFAATVLLRFLDNGGNNVRNEATRKAFQNVYQLFVSCTSSDEHVSAGKTLEVAGRAIVQGEAHLKHNVTTRMAASLMYDVVWLGGVLRGKSNDPEYSVEAAALLQISTQSQTPAPGDVIQHLDNAESNTKCLTGTPGQADNLAADHEWFDLDFPFGLWNDDIYDDWSDDMMTNPSVH